MTRLTQRYSRRVALVSGAIVALMGCSAEPLDQGSEPARPAKLMTVSKASSQESSSLPAVVRSTRSTELAFQVGGQIVEWKAFDGAEFSRGDVIARLDARSFIADVEQAEAQYKNADSEYRRAARLIDEDAISQSVLESRDADRQIAKAALDTARKNLSDTVLRAPFSGFVGRTSVEQFQNVSPQQTVLVLQSRAVEAIVNVPGSFVVNANRIRVLNTFVELDAAPERRLAATFSEATGVADSSTQTFEAHFAFVPPSDLLVLTGMTATLFFETEAPFEEAKVPGVSVPLTAIMGEGDKRFVWLVTGRDRTIERRDVTVASGVGEELRVTKGLKAGDIIVAAGGAYLEAGDRVRLWEG